MLRNKGTQETKASQQLPPSVLTSPRNVWISLRDSVQVQSQRYQPYSNSRRLSHEVTRPLVTRLLEPISEFLIISNASEKELPQVSRQEVVRSTKRKTMQSTKGRMLLDSISVHGPSRPVLMMDQLSTKSMPAPSHGSFEM